VAATDPEAIAVTFAGGGEKVPRNDCDAVTVKGAGGKFECIKSRFEFYPQ
jgi:hypothetical protein